MSTATADRDTWVLQPAIARAARGKKVVIGFDKDTATNPRVHASAAKLRARLHQAGVRRGNVTFLEIAGDDAGEKDGADDVLGRLAPDERGPFILAAINTAGPLGPAPETEQTTVDEKVVTDFDAGETYTMETVTNERTGKTITRKGRVLVNAGFKVLSVDVTTDVRGLGGGETCTVFTMQTARVVNGVRFEGQPFKLDVSKLETRAWYALATPGSEKGAMIQVARLAEVGVANAIRAAADAATASGEFEIIRIDKSGGYLPNPETGERCYVTADGALCADRFDPYFKTSHRDMLGADPFSIPWDKWPEAIQEFWNIVCDLTEEGRTAFLADLAHKGTSMMQAGRPAGAHVLQGGTGSGKTTLARGASQTVGVRSFTEFDDSKGVADEFNASTFDGAAVIDDGRSADDKAPAARRPGDDPDERFRGILQPVLRIAMEGGGKRRNRLRRDDTAARGYIKTETDTSWSSIAAVVEKMPDGLLQSDIMRCIEFHLGVHGRTWRHDRPGAVGRFELATEPGGLAAKVWAMIMVGAMRMHGGRGDESAAWVAAWTVATSSSLLSGWDPEEHIPDDDETDDRTWITIRRSWQEHIAAEKGWLTREAEIAGTYLAGIGYLSH